MRIFYIAHWLIPWLILALGMYAIVRFVRGYMNESAFTNADRRLMIVFNSLMGLQGLFGLIYFIWGVFITNIIPTYRVLHGIIMLVAAIIPHFSALWKDADDSTRYLNNFYLLLASFLIMLVGISLIPM